MCITVFRAKPTAEAKALGNVNIEPGGMRKGMRSPHNSCVVTTYERNNQRQQHAASFAIVQQG